MNEQMNAEPFEIQAWGSAQQLAQGLLKALCVLFSVSCSPLNKLVREIRMSGGVRAGSTYLIFPATRNVSPVCPVMGRTANGVPCSQWGACPLRP